MKISMLKNSISFCLLILGLSVYAQLPEAITITPADASGNQEITLTFDPSKACVPEGKLGLKGLDSIAMHSSAVLVGENGQDWNHIIFYNGMGADGTRPILYATDTGTYAITYNPSLFYGTGNQMIKQINAVFNDGFGWEREGKDHWTGGCMDFYIPLTMESTSVTFNVNMSHQIFLENFDPEFDFLDVAGNFNGWGSPGATMTDDDNDSIYSVTVSGLFIGQWIEYKFRIDKTWDNAEFPGGGANRTYEVQTSGNILDHWYNDEEPIYTTIAVNVSMNYWIELDKLDPSTEFVDIAGTFNGWGLDTVQKCADPDMDGIYTVIVDSIFVGEYIEYKIRINGDWNNSEFPGGGPNRGYTPTSDTNIINIWYDDADPNLLQGPFISEYLDGPGDNNAIAITSHSGNWDLSSLGIMYAVNGSGWQAPLPMSDTLYDNDTYFIVNPGFDFSKIDSAYVVDSVWAAATSFNGNDALALVKIYDGGNKYRILDQIGDPDVDPGTGWDVAGTIAATKDHRLKRKSSIKRGTGDWAASAGTNKFNSQWIVLQEELPSNFGEYINPVNVDNLWHLQSSGSSEFLKKVMLGVDGGGIAVGNNGTLLSSTNYGENWMQIPAYSTEEHLESLSFLPSQEGWVVGSGGLILHTLNGLNWEDQSFGSGNYLKDVHFIDSLTGWAVGEYIILHTNNGGETWKWQFAEQLAWLENVYFTDPDNGWIVSYNMVLQTNDGGQIWKRKENLPPDAHFLNVFFFNENIGWLVGTEGNIAFTINGGNNWTRQHVDFRGTLRDVHFISPTTGWIIGEQGKIFFTTNGGLDWREQKSGTDEELWDIYFVTPRKGWIVGANGTVLSTLDAWQTQTTTVLTELKSLFFIDDYTGWAVGEAGTILRTTDAGQNWDTLTKIHHVPAEPHYDIYFVDRKTGWIAGSGGIIYHTRDGGTTWEQQVLPTSQWLLSVFFLDKNTGWATGLGGTIARTVNGGENWDIVTKGAWLYTDVVFTDPMKGWACGEDGIIIYSEDGGASWTTQFTGTSAFLEAIHFTDASTGVAVGGGGTILRTLDGGIIWNPLDGGTGKHLDGLFYLDSMTAWICGEGGTVLLSNDGGATWKNLPRSVDKLLKDIFFISKEKGWAVGQDGIIIQTSSSGCRDVYVDLPVYTRICDGEAMKLDANINVSYLWHTGSTDSSIIASTEGYHKVTVRNLCNHEASDSIYLDVTELPRPALVANGSTIFCKGESISFRVDIQNNDGISNYRYAWDHLMKDTARTMIDTSGYVGVRVFDRFGCNSKDSAEVTVQYPFEDEEIGLVTVDKDLGKNIVVWEPTDDKGTEFYNVYKVQGTDHSYLGSVDFTDLTVYEDQTSMPRIQSDRYVITVVDTCGSESFHSASHKTIHLTANVGVSGEVNLIWEHYEGIPVNWYHIFRGADSLSLELLDSVAYDITKTQYTDLNPPPGDLYYQIGIKLPKAITLTEDKKAGTGPYHHSLSNMDDNKLKATGLHPQREAWNMVIFPNPMAEQTTVRFANPENMEYSLFIRDLSGKLVRMFYEISDSEIVIHRGDLQAGYYFIEVRGENVFHGKLIVK